MFAELFTLREQEVHAETDSQRRCPRADLFAEWLRQPESVQVPHSIAERADSRKNQLCSGADVSGIRSHQHVVSKPPQRILQAAQIVQFVIDDCYHSITTLIRAHLWSMESECVQLA